MELEKQGDWVKAIAADKKIYFCNPKTKESRWDPPPGWISSDTPPDVTDPPPPPPPASSTDEDQRTPSPVPAEDPRAGGIQTMQQKLPCHTGSAEGGGGTDEKAGNELEGVGALCFYCAKPLPESYLRVNGRCVHAECADSQLPRCVRCKELAEGKVIRLGNDRWHQHCFTCCMCIKKLKTYVQFETEVYCDSCGKAMHKSNKNKAGTKQASANKAVTQWKPEPLSKKVVEVTEDMSELIDPTSLVEGYLRKRGRSRIHHWQTRYFVLLSDRLEYYKAGKGVFERVGYIPLFNCSVVEEKATSSGNVLVVSPNVVSAKKDYELSCVPNSQDDLSNWKEKLLAVIASAAKETGLHFKGEEIDSPTAAAEGAKGAGSSTTITSSSNPGSSPWSETKREASDKEGYLKKRGGSGLKLAKQRFFALVKCDLFYYEPNKNGIFELKGKLVFTPDSTLTIDPKDRKCFHACPAPGKKSFALEAESENACEEW
eukprot:CAMPEP_0175134676 /NCGR_PEP_ID=MMETSP0087-20121206/8308_1 /TAXON_ID=136419 /ORGANISM="Unknown Unknown, Strain D1" /LENGTH=485 /DNA_ID=CAMNT_0016417259 /DNA_START=22 /DNA_END=1476 /DNA_ORIENTATION=+